MTAHRIPKTTDVPYVPLTMAQWLEQPVWMETWEEGEGIVSAKQSDWSEAIHKSRFDWEQGTNFGGFGAMHPNYVPSSNERDVARARLAAAAPDMARVLLDIEKRLDPDEYREDWNLSGIREALDAALRKAGVR